MPIVIQFTNQDQKEVYHYEMVKDPVFFPNLFTGILISSVYELDAKMPEGTVIGKFKLKVKNLKENRTDTLEFNDYFIGNNEASLTQAALKLIAPIQYLTYNWFSEISLEGIEVELQKIPQYRVASLEKAVLLNDNVKPGDTVQVRVFLRLYKGDYIDKIVKFTLPKNLSEPFIQLNISSAKVENINFSTQYAQLLYPKSYEQLLKLLSLNASFNEIAVWMDADKIGAVVGGASMPNLPLSKMMNFAFKESGNYFLKGKRKVEYTKTNYLIAGYLPVYVRIDYNQD